MSRSSVPTAPPVTSSLNLPFQVVLSISKMLPKGPEVAPPEKIQNLRGQPVQQPPVVSPLGPGPGRTTDPSSFCGGIFARAVSGLRDATTVAARTRVRTRFISSLQVVRLTKGSPGGGVLLLDAWN